MKSQVILAAFAAALACLAVAPSASAAPNHTWACAGDDGLDIAVCLNNPLPDSSDPNPVLACVGNDAWDTAVCVEPRLD